MINSLYEDYSKDERYIFNYFLFVSAITGLYGMMLGSLLPAISQEYELNNLVSGALLSSHQLGNLVAGFIAGILPLYIGTKRSIFFLSSFVVVGFTMMISTGNPLLLILSFLFTGLSRGGMSNFCNTVVNKMSASSPQALNVLHSVFAVGGIIAPFVIIISTKIGGDMGWKISAVVAIILVLISVFLASKIEFNDIARKKVRAKVSYAFLKNKIFWINAGIIFFYVCAEATINGWVVKYFVDEGIMTIEYAQMLASLLWVVMLAGRLTCAIIGGRFSKRKMLLAMSLGTIFFYILLLATRSLPLITIAIMGLGFSMAGVYPTTISSAGSFIVKYPMAMGVLSVLGGLGAITMQMITGAVAETYGIFAGMAAIIVVIVLLIIFAISNIKIKS